MAVTKTRIKPTPYPFLPFHMLRTAQLASSLTVLSITTYFARELHRTNYALPWTFILLLTISILTLLALTFTIILHIQHGLSPRLNLALNAALALVWTLSFALLAWWSSTTLTHACALETWESETGVAVCRMYKALFSMALLGMLASWGALGVDVFVQKGSARRGLFMSLGTVQGKRGAVGSGKWDEDDVDGGIWDMNPHAAALRDAGRERGGDGYALPEEQFGYADTAYAGAAGQVGRRSVEGRL
ncbi:uncharacterized protein EKO05_0010844 [Ascochyta rabiei]|uniref:Uncharacterized protein n=1 Tax=Didymella rabiei TaxID=5454 RepID=A0A163F5V6_DIDRA|nr:uncharacterized protein EKO05_0010844 [Ascochyta rabiei]KZM24166.1 hypothetical protein ST47_g4728 [Ascochyta rabiei]UPX20616.1 hypothetical protein EKO05_0010844 [Ascochyta rabiei]